MFSSDAKELIKIIISQPISEMLVSMTVLVSMKLEKTKIK